MFLHVALPPLTSEYLLLFLLRELPTPSGNSQSWPYGSQNWETEMTQGYFHLCNGATSGSSFHQPAAGQSRISKEGLSLPEKQIKQHKHRDACEASRHSSSIISTKLYPN